MHVRPELVPVRLPVLVWGSGQPRRALLLHGLAASGAGWWRVADGLAGAGFEVTAPDLRGHGAAPPATSYRLADLAADVALLGPAWEVVVAHSLGGPVAATLLRLGVSAERLVLLDPVFEIAAADLDAVVADQVAEADAFADPRAVAEANPRWHPDDAFHKAQAARRVSPLVVEQVLRDNAPWDHAHLLTGLGQPTRVLGGDPAVFTMFAPSLGARLAAVEPAMSYTAVPGVGHGVHRERPDVVIAAALGRR